MDVLIALAGVIVGVAITSGYSFWDVRRSELSRGVVAAHALDDELEWLRAKIPCAQSLTDEQAVSVWREQRAGLAQYLDYELFRTVAEAFQNVEHLKTMLASAQDDSSVHAVDEARTKASKSLNRAIEVLTDVREAAEKEHNAFILIPLARGLRDMLLRRSGPLPLMAPENPAYRQGSWIRAGVKVFLFLLAGVLFRVVFVSDDPITTGDAQRELREMEPNARLVRCEGDDTKDRWTCTLTSRPCRSGGAAVCAGRVEAESRLRALGDPSERALYFALTSTTLDRASARPRGDGERLRAWYRLLEHKEPPANFIRRLVASEHD